MWRRIAGTVLAATAAALLVFSALSMAWWQGNPREQGTPVMGKVAHIGLIAGEGCFTKGIGRCVSWSHFDRGETAIYAAAGAAAFAGGLASAALMLVLIIVALTRPASRMLTTLTWLTGVAVIIAAIGAGGFVTLRPLRADVPLGPAGPIFLGGAGVALVATLILGWRRRPTDIPLQTQAPASMQVDVMSLLDGRGSARNLREAAAAAARREARDTGDHARVGRSKKQSLPPESAVRAAGSPMPSRAEPSAWSPGARPKPVTAAPPISASAPARMPEARPPEADAARRALDEIAARGTPPVSAPPPARMPEARMPEARPPERADVRPADKDARAAEPSQARRADPSQARGAADASEVRRGGPSRPPPPPARPPQPGPPGLPAPRPPVLPRGNASVPPPLPGVDLPEAPRSVPGAEAPRSVPGAEAPRPVPGASPRTGAEAPRALEPPRSAFDLPTPPPVAFDPLASFDDAEIAPVMRARTPRPSERLTTAPEPTEPDALPFQSMGISAAANVAIPPPPRSIVPMSAAAAIGRGQASQPPPLGAPGDGLPAPSAPRPLPLAPPPAQTDPTAGGAPRDDYAASLPAPVATEGASDDPSPACPTCESPMLWVEEHLRFYCRRCRMYF